MSYQNNWAKEEESIYDIRQLQYYKKMYRKIIREERKKEKTNKNFEKTKQKQETFLLKRSYCKCCGENFNDAKRQGNSLLCVRCTIEYNKKRYEENKEKIKKSSREWRKNNIDKARKYNRIYIKTPLMRIKNSLKTNIRDSFRNLLNGKNTYSKSFRLWVGMTPKEFKQKLESMFEPWMNWGNYGCGKGRWVIDHIVPLASAENEEDLKKIWHHSNLRPYCYSKNLEK